jgi:phosphopentomutase
MKRAIVLVVDSLGVGYMEDVSTSRHGSKYFQTYIR